MLAGRTQPLDGDRIRLRDPRRAAALGLRPPGGPAPRVPLGHHCGPRLRLGRHVLTAEQAAVTCRAGAILCAAAISRGVGVWRFFSAAMLPVSFRCRLRTVFRSLEAFRLIYANDFVVSENVAVFQGGCFAFFSTVSK